MHFLQICYGFWLARFLFWTHNSYFYYLFAATLWFGTLYFYTDYFVYVFYLSLLQVAITMITTVLQQYYQFIPIDFNGIQPKGTHTVMKNGYPTHLRPKYVIYKNKKYETDEELKKLAGIVLRDMGWKKWDTATKRKMALAFVHQVLLYHENGQDKPGFYPGGLGFSVMNPFAPVYVAPKARSFWFKDGVEVRGWSVFTNVDKNTGYISFYRAYHLIEFNGNGDITTMEVTRYF